MNANRKNLLKLFLYSFLFLLGACNSSDTCVDQSSSTGLGTLKASSISFFGIDYIDGVSDTAATLNWTNVSEIGSYQIYFVNGEALTLITSIAAPATSYTVTGLSSGQTYYFKIRAFDNNGNLVNETAKSTLITNFAPEVPSGFALKSPSVSPGLDDTPTITVSGVKANDVVKLFSDSSCSTEVGSGISTGTTVDITIASPLSIASYTFYANAIGTNTSACSNVSVAYTRTNCPTGYIRVPGNATVGAASDFCVMKYEAKNDGSGNATSTEGTTPWVNITQVNAKSECQSLGAKYDLISNPEWMAIARNIENVASNWTNGSVGSGCLKRGNTGYLDRCLGGDMSYNGADPEFGASRNTLASLTLDNGEVIWDLSGNVWEWVDWTLGSALSTDMTQADKPYITADGAPITDWREFNILFTDNNFTALVPTTAIMPSDTTYSSAEAIGQYHGGISGGAAIRGGYWDNRATGGAFALSLAYSSSYTGGTFGFRCIFRP